jgi:hypothetical protein
MKIIADKDRELLLTALFEINKAGSYVAHIEELPEVTATGGSFEQTRSTLFNKLRLCQVASQAQLRLAIKFRYSLNHTTNKRSATGSKEPSTLES